MPKSLNWGMLCLCTLIYSKVFIKCFKNSKLLSGPNRSSERPSYLFSLGSLKIGNAIVQKQCCYVIVTNLLTDTKGQMKPKVVWARHRFFQKTNKQICFVCCDKQKSKQNKSVHSFFWDNLRRVNLLSVLSDL